MQLVTLRLILDRRGAVGVVGPLAEIHTMGTPFQAAAAGQPAALLEVEAIQQFLL